MVFFEAFGLPRARDLPLEVYPLPLWLSQATKTFQLKYNFRE